MLNKRHLSLSLSLYIIFCFLIMFCPISTHGLEHVIFVLWFCTIITIKKTGIGRGYRGLAIFLVFFFICSLLSGFLTAINRFIGMLETFSPFLAYFIYRKEGAKMYIISTIFLALMVFDAIYAVISIPSFVISGMRSVKSVTADVNQDLYRNGFEVVYSSAMLIPTLLFAMLKNKKWYIHRKKKFVFGSVLALAIAFQFVFILLSQFMTAILILFIGTALSFVYGRKFWIIKSFATVAIIIGGFLFFYSDLTSYIGTDDVTSKFLTVKMEEIHNVLTGNQEDAEDTNSRKDKTTSSIESFLNNPAIGLYYNIRTFEDRVELGIGNHSEWFDMLALYGLFAFLIYRFLYFRIVEQKRRNPCVLHIYLYLFLGFLNPLWNSFNNIVIFFVSPLFLMGLFRKKDKDEEYCYSSCRI